MSETPRTLGDVVMMHAKESDMCGTREGLNLLGLSHTTHHAAANMYLAALAIIKRQDTELTPALKDAERYRWLRENVNWSSNLKERMYYLKTVKNYTSLDDAIDSEITKEKS